MVKRYISPEKLVRSRFSDQSEAPRWDAAILCFRGSSGSGAMVDALSAKPLGRRAFWGMEETTQAPHVYTAHRAGMDVGVIARCVWGGPQAAILVEELSVFGVKTVIGYSCAGSLDPDLDRGRQLVVNRALGTDGTSRQYGDGPFPPDGQLLTLAPPAARVAAATVDAVYRETSEVVDRWRDAGAQVVNMEVAPFYAASTACGIRALWLGHVSDVLAGDWKDWFVDRQGMNRATAENCLLLLDSISAAGEQAGPADAAPRRP